MIRYCFSILHYSYCFNYRTVLHTYNVCISISLSTFYVSMILCTKMTTGSCPSEVRNCFLSWCGLWSTFSMIHPEYVRNYGIWKVMPHFYNELLFLEYLPLRTEEMSFPQFPTSTESHNLEPILHSYESSLMSYTNILIRSISLRKRNIWKVCKYIVFFYLKGKFLEYKKSKKNRVKLVINTSPCFFTLFSSDCSNSEQKPCHKLKGHILE